MKTLRLAVAAVAMAIVSACSNPEADWEKTEAENTEAAYQAFLDRYPDGEWAQRAQAQLDGIKDTRDWEHAQTSDAIAAYNNYLLAHPTGAYMGEARQRITELETEAAWATAQSAGTREAIEDFLVRYPDSPQAEQARTQLTPLSPPPPPAPAPKPAAAKAKPATQAAPAKAAALPKGGYQVQVGAFSSRDKAQSEKSWVEKRYGDVVGVLSIENPAGGEQVWRVKSAGLTEAAARSACQKLKASGQACVVVKR